MIPLKDDNPTSTFPYVTLFIIGTNVLVFIFQLGLGPRGIERFILTAGAIPYEITHLVDIGPADLLPPPFTLLTAMFVHGGLFHVAGNMLFLWIFGDNIEDSIGHIKFIIFYIITGLVASGAHILSNPVSDMPMIGASGAIAGVLGAYFLLFPRAKVVTLIFLFFFVTTVRVPAVFFLGLWFLYQLLGSATGGGIAWFAHIGGFVAGAVLIKLFRPKIRRRLFYG